MSWVVSRLVIAASDAARKIGVSLDKIGARIEVAQFTERLVPSTRFVAVNGVAPEIPHPATTFVAPNASLIGDVTLGKNSSVWYGATVRGDVNKVTIGENTSIGDRAVVHVAKIQGNFATSIGSHVTVCPGALVHAATLENSVVIGESAQVLDGAIVHSNTIIAPGSVVSPGTEVPSGEFWAGVPAKKVRALETEEIAKIFDRALETAKHAKLHAFETSKDYVQLAKDEELYIDLKERDETYLPRDPGHDPADVLGQGSPGVIFDSTLSHPEEGLKYKHKLEQEKKKKAKSSS